MRGVRAVVEYTGLSMKDALELPCDMFLLCQKNWQMEKLMETEEGRQYLDDCERYKQTKMDKNSLRRLMARMEGR